MTKGQRIGYFLSEWTVAWFIIPILGGGLLVDNSWLGVIYGLLFGAACCIPSWLLKIAEVKRLLRRYPPGTMWAMEKAYHRNLITCHKCHLYWKDDAKFCQRCGSPL
jgi:hypothetical protein